MSIKVLLWLTCYPETHPVNEGQRNALAMDIFVCRWRLDRQRFLRRVSMFHSHFVESSRDKPMPLGGVKSVLDRKRWRSREQLVQSAVP